MDNTKKSFGKITWIKKKIVCCFLCVFVVFNSFSAFAGSISVEDGPFTVSVRTNFPTTFVVSLTPTSVNSFSSSNFDLPCFTSLDVICNDSSYWNKYSYLRFVFNIPVNGAGIFTSYPSGAQFSHNLVTKSFVSDLAFVSVSLYRTGNNTVQVFYDCVISPRQNERVFYDCGFSDYGIITNVPSTSATASLTANPTLTPINKNFIMGATSTSNGILQGISDTLKQLQSQSASDSSKLSQLISLTTATNNLISGLQQDLNSGLGTINGTIKTESGNIINAVNLNAQLIKEQLVVLQDTLVSSLNTINNTLILIKNGIIQLDNRLHYEFNWLFTILAGYTEGTPDGKPASEIIAKLRDNWAEIISMGLDKVAPDTGALDTDMSNASSSLDSISKGDLISGITGSANQDNAENAFDTASSFFSGFGTKILYFNNRLMDIYNSLGDFRYVIIMTMVIGLVTFIFRVGNTFMRSRSGGGKDINLPRKLQ